MRLLLRRRGHCDHARLSEKKPGQFDLSGTSRAMQCPAFAWVIVSSSVWQRKTSLSQRSQ
jgi:hypothetical protein